MHLTLLAIDWVLLIEKCVLIAIIIALSLLIAMYETYAERKVAAFMQDRRGPSRAAVRPGLGGVPPELGGVLLEHGKRSSRAWRRSDGLWTTIRVSKFRLVLRLNRIRSPADTP